MSIDQKTKRHIIGFLARVIILAAAVYVIGWVTFGFHIYHGNAMAPWMRDGDLVITGRFLDLYADAVVVYKTGDGLKYGRIVAVPGDSVEITDKRYLINGNVPMESVYYDTGPAESSITYPLVVAEDCYFILNDMREDQTDSRVYGAIPKADIEGVIVLTMSRRGF